MQLAGSDNSDSSSELMSSHQSKPSNHADEEEKEQVYAVLPGYQQSFSSEPEVTGCKLKRQKASKMIKEELSHSEAELEVL